VVQAGVDGLCASVVTGGFDDVAASHLHALLALRRGNMLETRRHVFASLDRLITIMQSSDSNWLQPTLEKLCSEALALAVLDAAADPASSTAAGAALPPSVGGASAGDRSGEPLVRWGVAVHPRPSLAP
jgi:hypothetical protein